MEPLFTYYVSEILTLIDWLRKYGYQVEDLYKLTTLDIIARRRISEIPKKIGQLVHLRHLRLYDNQIVEIPKEIRTINTINRFVSRV